MAMERFLKCLSVTGFVRGGGEALQGNEEMLNNKCDEGALKVIERRQRARKNDEKAINFEGKAFNFNIKNVER